MYQVVESSLVYNGKTREIAHTLNSRETIEQIMAKGCNKILLKVKKHTLYAMYGNDKYITRFGGAREIVTRMDVKDIKIFLKHYKDHK